MKSGVLKAIVTSAGEGSRMKRVTSVVPKALLPLFKTENNEKIIVPVADYIMDSLALAGVSKFCFVVGKHRSLLMDYLFDRGVTFVFQNQPKGFGDAVLRGEDYASHEPVFVHADDGVLTGGYVEAASLFMEKDADVVLLLRKTDNPKRYGIAEVADAWTYMGHKAFRITGAEEKPKNPKSNMMISAVYVFSHKIFEHLKTSKPTGSELELTAGIQSLIKSGGKAYGILLEKERWLNVGDTDNYHKAIEYSFENL
ncbi:MAG: sugar nucleotidyltransferase [Candidatus Micrarchaeota archaeon]|nr:sugar nucleotidyltransferase [Candidatus Micrarchaeota archaeon]MDE1858936.1 sugar nucleotidyltransferase [Candidatus Micrarchaeota archaeon]